MGKQESELRTRTARVNQGKNSLPACVSLGRKEQAKCFVCSLIQQWVWEGKLMSTK
jgi:hypothetical protein